MHEWCQSNSSQHAETREACRRLGGNWTKYTCAEHVKYFDAQMHKALNQAHDTDTCAGVDVYGQPLLDHIRWPAQKCCSSYPASVCDKHAVKMDPCKSKEDFLAHHTMHQWCHFDHPPRPEDCSHHCGSDCHCASRGPCEALNGTWKEETCGYVFDHLDMETHKMLQTASESETCEGTDLHGQSLAQWVLPYAQQCCASYPASVCDKGLVRMTPCKDEGDFKPSTVMHAHCDFKNTFPEASVCNAQPGRNIGRRIWRTGPPCLPFETRNRGGGCKSGLILLVGSRLGFGAILFFGQPELLVSVSRRTSGFGSEAAAVGRTTATVRRRRVAERLVRPGRRTLARMSRCSGMSPCTRLAELPASRGLKRLAWGVQLGRTWVPKEGRETTIQQEPRNSTGTRKGTNRTSNGNQKGNGRKSERKPRRSRDLKRNPKGPSPPHNL